MIYKSTVILIALVLALLRLHGEISQTYQAIAHLFVGFILGVWFQRGITNKRLQFDWVGVVVIIISMVELLCFIFPNMRI